MMVEAYLRDEQIFVSSVTIDAHEDHAIAQRLSLLAKDIQTGKNISSLPGDLAACLQAALARSFDVNLDIEGDVEL
jgi:hypothetical protein